MERMLWSLLVACLLAVCQPIIAAPSVVQNEEPRESESLSDPHGRFRVPTPTNWRADEEAGYSAPYSPEKHIKIFFVALEGIALENAVARAWVTVDPPLR